MLARKYHDIRKTVKKLEHERDPITQKIMFDFILEEIGIEKLQPHLYIQKNPLCVLRMDYI